MISSETLREFATAFAAKHAPIAFDWHAKFGLSKDVQVKDARPVVTVVEPSVVEVVANAPAADAVREKSVQEKTTNDAFDTVENPPKEKKKLICMTCNAAIEYKVARFCWLNKKRFGGNAYCQECQTAFPK